MPIEMADDINVKVVTILQHIVIGHPMAHYFIHRGAYALREMHVVDGTGVGVMLYYVVVNEFIDIVESHAYLSRLKRWVCTLVWSRACFKVAAASCAADLSCSISSLELTWMGSLSRLGNFWGLLPKSKFSVALLTYVMGSLYVRWHWPCWCHCVPILYKVIANWFTVFKGVVYLMRL